MLLIYNIINFIYIYIPLISHPFLQSYFWGCYFNIDQIAMFQILIGIRINWDSYSNYRFWFGMLVFSFAVWLITTNSWLRATHIYYLTVSVGQDYECELSVFCSVSQQAEIKVLPGAAVSSKALDPLSDLLVVGRILFHVVLEQRTSAPKGLPLFPNMWFSSWDFLSGKQECISASSSVSDFSGSVGVLWWKLLEPRI